MGIFFEEDVRRKKYPKPRVLVTFQLVIMFGLIGFLIMGISQEASRTLYLGIANLLLVASMGIDEIFYYTVTKKWRKKPWLMIILFLILGVSLIIAPY
ncbi:hypothetical protein [Gracilibacillus alcaliphilus]|uniref:hypothetical protein n=1 Tax=Gracilibacillus alcaliphilus TaxID=1401441 RepID=UPI0019582D1E|nr:hypothetical protein [Gracilibacillus alcaliphilus]MBM7676335.1 F0F1-type ATP synthase assembly protein I [Gracilibacillus alcaliphilus]